MRLLATALVMLVPTVAVAQTTPVPPTAPAPKEKKICREEAPTGSIFPKRTCRTKTEWATVDAANEKANEQYRNHRGDGAQPPGI